MLKPILLFSAAILLAIGATPVSTIVLGASPQQPDATSPVKPTSASLAQAKTVYGRDCALCHGEHGDGKTDLAKDMQLTLMDWTDPKSLGNRSDKELFHVIRTGKDKMPAEEDGRAKDSEVWNLIVYIRGFSKGHASAPPDAVPPAATPDAAAPPAAAPADPAKPNN